jgi:predicted DsbA family dithiol-disulfide isomerase
MVRIAEECGMTAANVSEKLHTGDDEDVVTEKIQQSAARGVSGVPFFIINNEYGISGAQPAETLVEIFDQIMASEP